MIRLSQDRAKTLLAIHGWSGVLLGLLLYAVILTGVISVFADEIGDWSSPLKQQPVAPFPTGLDAKLRELAGTVDPKFLEDLSFFPHAGGRIQTFFHHHVMVEGEPQPLDFGVEFDLHPQTLEVLDRREGFGEDIAARNNSNALSDFLVELHVSLHLPDPYGFFVTGILGLAMMVAAVTGLLVHRHLLKELFTIRRFREALLARRDAHVIAATWNLPFAFVLAFTGSFFSFSSSVGIPAMAMVAFGGDQAALIETIVGTPSPENTAPATLASIDAMLANAAERAHTEPAFVSVSHYGRADARVTVFTRPADGELLSHNLVYDGPTGAFLQEKPGLGLVPSTGGALSDLMGPLHFGNFAGVLSKAVWFALGFASCYVALTGMLLWTTRRAESSSWQRMARAVTWMGFGLPLSLALAPWGYFIGRAYGSIELEAPMAIAFLCAAFAAAVTALLVNDPERLRRLLLGTTGLALMGLPALRLLTGGPGWIAALGGNLVTIPSLDLALMLGGVLCVLSARRKATKTTPALPASDDEAEVAA
ncbi:MAG: PepSY-associated TM helix domain-containing protein [Panacagrimonas sp.]